MQELFFALFSFLSFLSFIIDGVVIFCYFVHGNNHLSIGVFVLKKHIYLSELTHRKLRLFAAKNGYTLTNALETLLEHLPDPRDEPQDEPQEESQEDVQQKKEEPKSKIPAFIKFFGDKGLRDIYEEE